MSGPRTHSWAFARRFRAGAFGWKSQPAITRVKEAVAEITRVARRDPVLAAEGAVLFLEKVSPALQHVDGSSGAIGTAVNHAVDVLAALIARAPADDATRDRWLERLWDAYLGETIPYIERLGDHWGALCATRARASGWANRLLPTLRTAWADRRPGGYFPGTPLCLSSLLAAGRCQELLDILQTAPFVWWGDRQWGVRALAALGRIDEAIAYARASLGPNDGPGRMARLCEEILLAAGRANEAYRDYAIEANWGMSRLATFRVIARKYPHKDNAAILRDLIESTPGDEGKWFATAKDLGLLDLAVQLAHRSPCDPKTLNRAARDRATTDPAFAHEVALASLRWLSEGWGYEITGLDVLTAYEAATRAARAIGCEDATRARILALVEGDRSPGAFVAQVLRPRLGLA
ncbi:MAG: hypothetical protein HY561_05180 [Gemmatimonadetes bacterium]|nr:hypothetical protein [Gemmatimonadota bacterium]